MRIELSRITVGRVGGIRPILAHEDTKVNSASDDGSIAPPRIDGDFQHPAVAEHAQRQAVLRPEAG